MIAEKTGRSGNGNAEYGTAAAGGNPQTKKQPNGCFFQHRIYAATRGQGLAGRLEARNTCISLYCEVFHATILVIAGMGQLTDNLHNYSVLSSQLQIRP